MAIEEDLRHFHVIGSEVSVPGAGGVRAASAGAGALRAGRLPRLVQALDLRFPGNDGEEAAFKVGLQRCQAAACLAVSAGWLAAACAAWALLDEGFFGCLRVEAAILVPCSALAAASALAGTLRLRCSRLAWCNWECWLSLFFAGITASTAIFFSFCTERSLVLAVLLVLAGACLPVRSCVSWIFPMVVVTLEIVRLATHEEVQPDTTAQSVLTVLLAVLSYHTSRQHEQLLRFKWQQAHPNTLLEKLGSLAADGPGQNQLDEDFLSGARDVDFSYDSISDDLLSGSTSDVWETHPFAADNQTKCYPQQGDLSIVPSHPSCGIGSSGSSGLSTDALIAPITLMRSSGNSMQTCPRGVRRSFTRTCSLGSDVMGRISSSSLAYSSEASFETSISVFAAKCPENLPESQLKLTVAFCTSQITLAAVLRAAEISIVALREETALLMSEQRRDLSQCLHEQKQHMERRLYEHIVKYNITKAQGARPDGLPRPSAPGDILPGRPPWFQAFDGIWGIACTEDLQRSSPWLHAFQIKGDTVIDGEGRSSSLVLRNDEVTFAGGVLFMHGKSMFRVGKSGAVRQYKRMEYSRETCSLVFC